MAKGYAHQQSLEKIYGKTSNVFLSRQSKSSSKLFATPTTAAATGNLLRESGNKMKDNMKASKQNFALIEGIAVASKFLFYFSHCVQIRL